jgi:hypothetical protein
MTVARFILSLVATASILAAVSAVPCRAAVWQWSVPVVGGRDRAGPARAFLWIPPDCRRVRGVVVSQNNMEEESILESPIFRRTLSDLGFAEVWVAPSFDLLFHFNDGAGETFDGMMKALAENSGYRELNFAPVIPMGHSAAASFPYYLAAWNPQRTLAALSVSGQWPYFRNTIFAPDIWGNRVIDGIPALETMGEYESAESWAGEGLHERTQHPLTPLSMLANPGQGHFAATDEKIAYLGLYLRKAAHYRLPQKAPVDGPPTLLPIDPTKTGWLADRWRRDRPPVARAAPVGAYQGDPKEAFWFFDEELARATELYQAADRGKKVELVGIVQDGALVPQRDEHLQLDLKFEPDTDGVTFHLGTAFYETVPGGSPRPATWTGLPAGSPIGHATGGGPISIDRVIGPFEKVGPDTFRVSLQKEMVGTERQFELVFAATHPGDAEYRPAVQQAHLLIPARNTKGVAQRIDFAEIPPQSRGATVKLRATSDAGVPVSFYVLAGPAELEGDTLVLTPIPPGAQFPVTVTVVAWQYGRSCEPFLQTAEPVRQTFLITK